MFFQSASGDQDIIHIDEDGTSENEVFEQLIHHGLERGGGIHKAEKHYEWFEHSAIGFERGFPLISGTDTNIVISPSNIELREDSGGLEFIDDVGNQRERILIFNRERVQLTVVLDQAQLTILLLDKEERRGEGGLRRANITSFGHIFEEGIKGNLFTGTKGIDFAIVFGNSVGFQLDSMIPFTEWGQGLRGRFLKD